MKTFARFWPQEFWLLGTSRGSTSVANAGIRLQRGGPDGLVLMSAISVKHKRGGSLLRMSLGSIKVPTLVVHHVDDGCGVTLLEGARDIHSDLKGAPVTGLIKIKGGKERVGPCTPTSHHKYNAQRGPVVKAITQWILAH
jgi:pimeloyl-ACP methyl ester carboxylesterase